MKAKQLIGSLIAASLIISSVYAVNTDVDETQVRDTLSNRGYKDAIVQHTSTGDFIVRLATTDIITNQSKNQQLISGLNTQLNTTTEQKDLSVLAL